jgi:hypothetical protein
LEHTLTGNGRDLVPVRAVVRAIIDYSASAQEVEA